MLSVGMLDATNEMSAIGGHGHHRSRRRSGSGALMISRRRGSCPGEEEKPRPRSAGRRGSLYLQPPHSDVDDRPSRVPSPRSNSEASDWRSKKKDGTPNALTAETPSLLLNYYKHGDSKKTGGALKNFFGRFKSRASSYSDDYNTIEVHAYTHDPTEAWEWMRTSTPFKPIKPLHRSTPISDEKVRFVCMSDTHGRRLDDDNIVDLDIPDGDVLIVAGDFTSCGHPDEIGHFNDFLGRLPHAHKLIVCGNHELTFDQDWVPSQSFFPSIEKLVKSENSRIEATKSVFREALRQANVQNPRQLLTNGMLLEDTGVTLFGIRIYGTPWIPKFDGWAYNVDRGQAILDKWNNIPSDTSVLVTHTPPLGFGDTTESGTKVGCVELLNTVRKRVRPRYHVFGHVHEGYGCYTDGTTKFVNACSLDAKMRLSNAPIIFDMPLSTDQLPKSRHTPSAL